MTDKSLIAAPGYGICADCGDPLTDREMLLGQESCDVCEAAWLQDYAMVTDEEYDEWDGHA